MMMFMDVKKWNYSFYFFAFFSFSFWIQLKYSIKTYKFSLLSYFFDFHVVLTLSIQGVTCEHWGNRRTCLRLANGPLWTDSNKNGGPTRPNCQPYSTRIDFFTNRTFSRTVQNWNFGKPEFSFGNQIKIQLFEI